MTRQPVLLVGSGGLAREVVEVVEALNAVEPRWDLLGFTDDDPALEGTSVKGLPVLGTTREAVAAHPDAQVVLCTGNPRDYFSRRRIEQDLGLPPERYATLVHPGAWLAGSVEVGAGSVVLAGAVGTGDAVLGRHVCVMPGTVITHDDVVGTCVNLAAGVKLAGGVVLGDECYVGAGALIGPGVAVGPGALIGMGAVVRHDVPALQVWVGNPARWLRDVEHPPAAGDRPRGRSRETRTGRCA